MELMSRQILTKTPKLLLYILAILLSTGFSPVWATDVFVGNQVFEGPVVGAGKQVSLGLAALAEALELEVVQGEDGWTLAGKKIDTRTADGTVWVDIGDLPKELIRIVYSKELNTLDLYKQKVVSSSIEEPWSGEGTLVFFYGDWSAECRAMYSTVMNLKQSRTLKVELLDVDVPKAKVFRKYIRHFKGNGLPYFVVLDKRGRKIHSFVGVHSYPAVIEELKKAFAE